MDRQTGKSESGMNFADNFFDEEYRCGFKVEELMKRAWAASMEVLQVVIDICQKNNITYFADAGTLLGAIRHQGFIPWDDDIDIALKREDYNRLISVLPGQLPEGFVMAGMYAASERLQKAAEVQQLRVIADEEYWSFPEYLERFHGFPYPRIGIDIFSLDYIPRDSELADLHLKLINKVRVVLENREMFQAEGQLEAQLQDVERLCNVKIERDGNLENQLWRLLDGLYAMFTEEESDEVTNFTFLLWKNTYRQRKEWYDEAMVVPFENMEIAVPKHYHEVLTSQYGDYMTPQKATALHDYPFYKDQQAELERIFKSQGIEVGVTEFCRNWMQMLSGLK